MSAHHSFLKTPLLLAIGIAIHSTATIAAEDTTKLDEMVVEGESQSMPSTHYSSPSTKITEYEVEGINATTVEDFVKYEPSMVVRRRYIGDANGVVGMRGANMFQTARTMVYADGLPLHYLLQTRWSGSPRWSLVATDETESAEVVYGPFSAEYSGNAMGGVINIKTKMPTERQFHAEAGIFSQSFQHMGADDTYTGHREFISYGDRFDKVSLYAFHNHLENESQPMSFRSDTVGGLTGTAVTGAYKSVSTTGADAIYYADSGKENVTTDLTKLKLGYDMGEWQSRFTVAYEDRDKDTSPTNYLVDANGDAFWSGDANFNGEPFDVRRSNFKVSEQNRQTVLLGAGAEGPTGPGGWILDANVSYFDVLEDKTLSSNENPADPTYDGEGTISEYDDTGWETLDLKARTDHFAGRNDMNFVAGIHYDHYSLNINSYDSDNYVAGVKTSQTTSVGGETQTHAVFAQLGYDFAPQWDLVLGARYERWKMLNGRYYRYSSNSLEDYTARTETGFSPKFSLGFNPSNPWQYRYSIAKAYRFPIVEELYKNEDSIDGTSIANEHLEPEVGLHHNIMAEREITRGSMRVNIYHEEVKDVIFNQTDIAADVSTFLPVDEVTTTGVEFMIQQQQVMESDVDMRFNVTWTNSNVTKNSADPTTIGMDFPRMPRWRANLLSTYHINVEWDTSLGIRYASNSYGNLDNSDTATEIYGVQDSYLFADLKANYQINPDAKVSVGVDNLTDEVAFVAHPWAQRTIYVQGSLDF